MEKILIIDGREIAFKCTGAYLLRYKTQFGTDALRDIYQIQTTLKDNRNIFDIDSEILFNLTWTLAKTADSTIKPPMEWLDTFKEFPIYTIFPQIVKLIFDCLYSGIEVKKN